VGDGREGKREDEKSDSGAKSNLYHKPIRSIRVSAGFPDTPPSVTYLSRGSEVLGGGRGKVGRLEAVQVERPMSLLLETICLKSREGESEMQGIYLR